MSRLQTFTRESLPEEGWRSYVKVANTKMIKIDGPFTVETKEGSLFCHDGWLALDQSGWPYPISDTDHRLTYREVMK